MAQGHESFSSGRIGPSRSPPVQAAHAPAKQPMCECRNVRNKVTEQKSPNELVRCVGFERDLYPENLRSI